MDKNEAIKNARRYIFNLQQDLSRATQLIDIAGESKIYADIKVIDQALDDIRSRLFDIEVA